MHGDYCPTKDVDLKDWIKEHNYKPGDAVKCPHCRQVVRVPAAANPPAVAGLPAMPTRRLPRRHGPEHIAD